jgi:hypothetical protein
LAGKQVLISETVYLKNILRINVLPFPNIYADSSIGKFKSRVRRKLLEKDGLKILVRNLCHHHPSMKPVYLISSFSSSL